MILNEEDFPNLCALERKKTLINLGKNGDGYFYHDSYAGGNVFLSDDDLILFEATGNPKVLLQKAKDYLPNEIELEWG